MTLVLVREEEPSILENVKNGLWSGEAVVFCPSCKALQTVWMNGTTLVPTRKFIQAGSEIFHDCGSGEPCRLYYGW
ncbi:MAG: hypothetical protein V1894_00595 [Chloroflexota bacterium]